MAQYLLKYKGKYRILPELDLRTNDFQRDSNGCIDQETGIYIKCKFGCKISFYGLNESKRGVLLAYIPSKYRGRNIKKSLEKQGVEVIDYDESDEESVFKFLASDIDIVSDLMKASTYGANISPFSTKNLPKAKVVIPEEEIAKYKSLVSRVDKNDMLIFNKFNNGFLNDVLAKELRPKGKRKLFDFRSDMKQMKLSHDTKGYIWEKGLFNKYLDYLEKEIDSYYNN